MSALWRGIDGSWSLVRHVGHDLYGEYEFEPDIAAILMCPGGPVSHGSNLESYEVGKFTSW